jgi:hypothetical protein
MSVKLDIYQAIKAQLETLTFIENVLHYNGQDLLDYEEDHAKRFPQAWIQLTNIPWLNSEKQPNQANRTHQQKSEDGVVVTIFYASFSLNDDDDTFETDLANIHTMHNAITMLEGTNFNPLQRRLENDLATNNNVRVWATQYTTMLTEQSETDNETDAAPITLTINKTILP